MPRLWCAICGAALRRTPDSNRQNWLYVAVRTETRTATEPLPGFLGPPIFPEFEVTAGSVWASNLLPTATTGPTAGYYAHGVPAGTGWFDPLVGHVHVPGPALEAVQQVPVCCGWPMRLTPDGWLCRVDERRAVVPLAA